MEIVEIFFVGARWTDSRMYLHSKLLKRARPEVLRVVLQDKTVRLVSCTQQPPLLPSTDGTRHLSPEHVEKDTGFVY